MKTIYEFPVYYSGRECDETGRIKEDADGTRVVILTSHGKEYNADRQELLDKVVEYYAAIGNTMTALRLLDNA